MIDEKKLMKCPLCGADIFIGVHDDEGNYHGRLGCEYESNPWSGLTYALYHDGDNICILNNDDNSMGNVLFDNLYETIEEWNNLTQPKVNKWIPCSERLPEANQMVLSTENDSVIICCYEYIDGHGYCFNGSKGNVIAWMPLPEPYQEEKDE